MKMNGMERKIVYLYNKYLFMLAEKHINGTIAIGLMWDGVEINGIYDVLNGFVVCLVLSCLAMIVLTMKKTLTWLMVWG